MPEASPPIESPVPGTKLAMALALPITLISPTETSASKLAGMMLPSRSTVTSVPSGSSQLRPPSISTQSLPQTLGTALFGDDVSSVTTLLGDEVSPVITL